MSKKRWAWRTLPEISTLRLVLQAVSMGVGGCFVIYGYYRAVLAPFPGNIVWWVLIPLVTVCYLAGLWAFYGPIRVQVDEHPEDDSPETAIRKR